MLDDLGFGGTFVALIEDRFESKGRVSIGKEMKFDVLVDQFFVRKAFGDRLLKLVGDLRHDYLE